jgi:VWFA-related protein
MFKAPAAAVVAGLVGVAVLVRAQEPTPQQQQPVFRGRIETVAVPVTVFDPENSLVTNLTREDFTVYDNGKKQEITTFSSGLQPIRAVALVDVSASMTPVLDEALSAAELFVDRLRPDDRARVGMFSTQTWMSPEFTANRDALLSWLHRDQPYNNPTRLLDAIDDSITALLPETGRRVVMVFTDGCDTASQMSWEPLLERVRAEDVMVYAVMFKPHLEVQPPPQHEITFGYHMPMTMGTVRPSTAGLPCLLHYYLELKDGSPISDFKKVDDPRWLRGPALVDQLATETGGGRVVLTPKEEMNRLFTTILNELHYLYLLGFTPQTPDGKVHDLNVKLKDPKLMIRARQHYVAPTATRQQGRH